MTAVSNDTTKMTCSSFVSPLMTWKNGQKMKKISMKSSQMLPSNGAGMGSMTMANSIF